MQVSGYNGRSHRTLLVFDFTNADSEFIERANRLNESVNGPNIKVDIVSIHDGKAVSGFHPESVSVTSTSDNDIASFAAAKGYDQFVVSRSV